MAAEQSKRTEVSALGEFGLIDQLTKNIALKNPGSVKGVGDDAAILQPSPGMLEVVTTDLLMEGIHFDLSYTPLKHLGYKAVVVNLSDVYAMNALPRQVTFSIAFSNRFSVEALEEIYEGALLACDIYGVDMVGGDTSASQSGLAISVTAIGEGKKEKLVQRNNAKAGDLICVTGDLGAAYLGLQILEREKQIWQQNPEIQPDLQKEQYLIGKFLKPEARKDIIEYLTEASIVPTAMIDVSDGLSSDLLHICTQSAVGCEIREADIPIQEITYNRALDFNLDPSVCTLHGGEDYELLMTIDPKDADKMKNNPLFSTIGEITPPDHGYTFITKGGTSYALEAQGWKHV